MKRFFALTLFAAILFSLVSCGPENPGTAVTSETATAAATDETLPYPVISAPFLRETLEAIPTATADMKEDQLREICVRYMLLQASVVWTPDENLTYPCTYASNSDGNGNLHLTRGVRYGGLPYSSAARDLASFLDYYDSETGVLNASQFKLNVGDMFGNNCGTACFWGWSRISSTITYSGTRTMTYGRGCIPLGDYKYDLTLETFDETTTKMICEANGEQTMYESYALLKPASGLAMYNAGITGHARMAQEAAVVVRKSDGKIDPDSSYVLCVEQVSKPVRIDGEDGSVYGIGKFDQKYTFRDLYKSGYLPFEVPELCGKATVQKAKVELECDSFETAAALSEGTIRSNYCISRVDLVIRDVGDNVVYTNSVLGSSNASDQYAITVNRVLRTGSLSRNLKKGQTYTFSFTARLGNGETLPVFSAQIDY